jgi:hypothetical protein
MKRARQSAIHAVHFAALLVLTGAASPRDEEKPSVSIAPAAEVRLPLEEYERLKKVSERPSLTVVDSLRFSGSFRKRDLSLTLTGRAAGSLPREPILSGEGMSIFDCQGDAILSRGEGSGFELTPLGPKFALQCRLSLSGSDRLEMETTSAVLWVESQVSDGEFVSSGGARHSFSIVRVSAETSEAVRPTVAARYRISLQPEETRFRHQLEVRNPNRFHAPFDLTLASGERVQQVDARALYEQKGAHYRFDLPPGETTLVLSGTLAGNTLTPPVDASIQYVLLEAHPLLRPLVTSAAKRISPPETGMAAEFRGAQAYLLGAREPLSWGVTRLEALRTTSFALASAEHRFFLDTSGLAMGESAFQLDNQGASDIELPMKAEPTFASLQEEPVLLTKNAQGSLWLPLAQGKQSLLIQHRQALHRSWGLAYGELTLPKVGVPATRAGIELRYPAQWEPLYESFAPDSQFFSPSSGTIFWMLALGLWTERALAALRFTRRRRMILSGLLTLASMGASTVAVLLVLGDLAVTATWAWSQLFQRKHVLLKAGVVVAAALVAFFFAIIVMSNNLRALFATSTNALGGASSEMRDLNAFGNNYRSEGGNAAQKPQRQQEAPMFQGLPAKFEMPSGVKSTRFSREMLRSDDSRPVHLVLLSKGGAHAFELLLALLSIALALSQARRAISGFREFLARLRAPPPASPEQKEP